MHEFHYKNNQLYCEKVPVKILTEEFGTPLYIYSYKTIVDHYTKIKCAFKEFKPLICYSVKANSNLSLMNILIRRGAGLDIVSGGELYRAKYLKCPSKRIVYASVGKREDEIKDAIEYGILLFNVESHQELKKIDSIARKLKRVVDVSLRYNPDIDALTHQYITTGKRENKFGMDIDTIKEITSLRRDYKNIRIRGLHIHIGSQITEAQPFIKALLKVKDLGEFWKKEKIDLYYLNIGGGLGIVYDKERPQSAQDFASAISGILKDIHFKKLILEPGRFIVGNAGILLTKVLYVKTSRTKTFIIVDAGMNDLIRPSLYCAYHKIDNIDNSLGEEYFVEKADIVGPICESSDFLGKERSLKIKGDDILAVFSTGAYGFSMSSNYNSRPRCAEVLVKGNKYYLIRERENYKDLIRKEKIVSV